ncbi:MAG: autotransporter-associated beta strand repeat-containing protein [Pirellulales bacterium]
MMGVQQDDTFGQSLVGMLQHESRYELAWVPTQYAVATNAPGYPGTPFYNAYTNYPATNDEKSIRPLASVAYGTAVLIATDTYSPSVGGMPREEALYQTELAIRGVAFAHRSNATGTPQFGGRGTSSSTWQAAHWAAQAARAAWLLWDELTPATRTAVANMMVDEADSFTTFTVPYWKSPNGSTNFSGDSKAEENAWNAQIPALAQTMMPNHPNADAWRTKASELQISAYNRQSDTTSLTLVDGKPAKDWLNGFNAAEDGVVINHSFIHPDYMVSINTRTSSMIYESLAGQHIPQSTVFSVDNVYRALTELHFTPGPDTTYGTNKSIVSPGGTIYKRSAGGGYEGTVYYPQGTDWTYEVTDSFLNLDLIAEWLGLDSGKDFDAMGWAQARVDAMIELQNRPGHNGNIYVPDDWVGSSRGVDEDLYRSNAAAWLQWWLLRHDQMSPIGDNWGSLLSVNMPSTFWDGNSSDSTTAWLTNNNWDANAFPGSQTYAGNTDIATFSSTGTSGTIGLNLNFSGNRFYVGAIQLISNNSRSIGNNSTVSGVMQLNGTTVNGVENVVLRNAGTAALTVNRLQTGVMELALGNTTDNVIQIASSGAVSISSVISGVDKHITLQGGGSGALTLSADNTYTGGTTLSSSVLVIANSSNGPPNAITSGPIGTGPLVLNGGTLSNNGNRTLSNKVTLANAVNNVQVASSTTFILSGDIEETDGPANLTVTKSNSGNTTSTLVLSGNNTYSGSTTVVQPASSSQTIVLRITSSSALGTVTGGTTLPNRARLELAGDFTTWEPLVIAGQDVPTPRVVSSGGSNEIAGDISTMSGGNNYSLQANGTLFSISGNVVAESADRGLMLGGTGVGWISGDIRPGIGSGKSWNNVSKSDAGTWILAGNNAYTGITMVNGGTLLVNGTHSGGGNYVIASGATFGGQGNLGQAALTVAAGGSIAPGDGIGNLSAGSADINGRMSIEFGNNAIDKLTVAGDLDIFGAELDFASVGSMSFGKHVFITYGDSLTGSIEGLEITFNGEAGLPETMTIGHDAGQLYMSGYYSPGLPGDFNADARVDVADYIVWRSMMGDNESYLVWRKNFGSASGIAAGSSDRAHSILVPEPSSLGLWLVLSVLRGRLPRIDRSVR